MHFDLARLGGAVIFVLVLLSYTFQTQFASYIQTQEHFAQPYLLLYLSTHYYEQLLSALY